MSELASVQVIVHGYVQGVFFRNFTSRRAKELDLAGQVRNLPGGAVEVRAEGERERLEELIGHLRVGPPGAVVGKLEVSWSQYSGSYSHFGIGY